MGSTKPKPFCFVLMPFKSDFDDVYRLGIKEACDKGGAYSERVDDQIYHHSIMERVYNQIAKADFIVADMTGQNPNVFYEVGYAHALGKPAVLLTQRADDIPFDLKHYPHIVYGDGGGKIIKLRDDLTKHVEWFVANPSKDHTESEIGIELYLGEQNLSTGKAIATVPIDHLGRTWDLIVENTSPRSLERGSFHIGAITKPWLESHVVLAMKLPTGESLHIFGGFAKLFPRSFIPFELSVHWEERLIPPIGTEEPITLRVYTDHGTRDYPLIIQWTKPVIQDDDV